MTTNQTIDGVSRATLEILLSGKGGLAQAAAAHELRALLDEPVSPLSELEVLRAAVKELETMRDARVDAKLAQGEPVAIYQAEYLGDGGGGWSDVGYREYKAYLSNPKFNTRIVYAEQPAPVAVDRPVHATPPPGTEPCGTHHDNDGLDDYRNTK